MTPHGACKIWTTSVVAGVVVALSAGWSVASVAQRPSWDLPVVGGGRLSLAGLRGQIVVASFGATWCPPCRTELRALQSLADQYRGKNVSVLWITIDDQDVSDEDLARFVKQLGVSIPVLRDVNGSAYAQFRQTSLPMLVVIDPQGNLVGNPSVGFSDPQSFIQKVTQLIESVRG